MHSEMKRGTFWKSSKSLKNKKCAIRLGKVEASNKKKIKKSKYLWCDRMSSHHVDSTGCLAEDHEMCYSQWSCNRHKVLKYILFPNLFNRIIKKRSPVQALRA